MIISEHMQARQIELLSNNNIQTTIREAHWYWHSAEIGAAPCANTHLLYYRTLTLGFSHRLSHMHNLVAIIIGRHFWSRNDLPVKAWIQLIIIWKMHDHLDIIMVTQCTNTVIKEWLQSLTDSDLKIWVKVIAGTDKARPQWTASLTINT